LLKQKENFKLDSSTKQRRNFLDLRRKTWSANHFERPTKLICFKQSHF